LTAYLVYCNFAKKLYKKMSFGSMLVYRAFEDRLALTLKF
jgi:hypothetical protein